MHIGAHQKGGFGAGEYTIAHLVDNPFELSLMFFLVGNTPSRLKGCQHESVFLQTSLLASIQGRDRLHTCLVCVVAMFCGKRRDEPFLALTIFQSLQVAVPNL